MSHDVVTSVVAQIGAFTGAAGLALGIMNFWRDRGSLQVELAENIIVTGMPQYPPHRRWGVVSIANRGRRPIWFSSASLILDTGEQAILFNAQATRLEEGSEPARAIFDKGDIYDRGYSIVCARATDALGRKHYSSMSFPNWLRVVGLRLQHKI